jgi:site-specific recombinase XerD
MPPACADAVKKYIQHRGIAALPKRHVFSSKTHEKMTVSCIEEVFKKYISIAKTQHPDMFSERSYPPHSMRHTTACHLLESGVSLMVIKNFLGHSSIMTTQIYYGKKNLMTSCTGRCRDLLKHLPEQLFIINVSVH